MLELIAIALLQIASFSGSTETKADPSGTNSNNPIVILPADNEQGGGGWGGGMI